MIFLTMYSVNSYCGMGGAMVRRINGASIEQLDAWFDRILDAASLGGVLDHRMH